MPDFKEILSIILSTNLDGLDAYSHTSPIVLHAFLMPALALLPMFFIPCHKPVPFPYYVTSPLTNFSFIRLVITCVPFGKLTRVSVSGDNHVRPSGNCTNSRPYLSPTIAGPSLGCPFVPLAYCGYTHGSIVLVIPNLPVTQLTPSTTLLNGLPAHSIILFPTPFMAFVALERALVIPSPILPGNAFAPSTILLNCFLTPPHISFAIPINLSFIVVTLDMIRPTKEFSILFLICKIDTLNLVLTYSHKSVILLLKFRTKSIIDKIIRPTNEFNKLFTI